MYKYNTLILIAALLSCITANATTLIFKSDSNQELAPTIYLTDNKLRIDNEGSSSILFDRSANTLFIIEDDEKTFYVIDQAQVEALAETLGQVNQQIEQALAQLPPGQRAQARLMMESLLPGGGANNDSQNEPVIDVKFTGASDNVANIACKVVETWVANQLESELCIANSDALELTNGEIATLKALGRFSQQMLDAVKENFGSLIPENIASGSLITALNSGIPIRMVHQSNGDHSELQSVNHAAISDELTNIPEQYERKRFELGL